MLAEVSSEDRRPLGCNVATAGGSHLYLFMAKHAMHPVAARVMHSFRMGISLLGVMIDEQASIGAWWLYAADAKLVSP